MKTIDNLHLACHNVFEQKLKFFLFSKVCLHYGVSPQFVGSLTVADVTIPLNVYQ